MKKLSEELRTALARLDNGENWGKGNFSGKACSWTCQQSPDAAEFFAATLGFDLACEVFEWNDNPTRTWPEVKQAFEEAIAAAEAGEKA